MKPMLEVFALVKRNWTGSQRCSSAPVWIVRRAKPSPANSSRKTEPIQPVRIVVANPRGQNRGFPAGQWQLTAVQWLQHRFQTLGTLDTMFRINVLPREEKAIKILWRNGPYFGTQPIDREPMDPCQQSPIAPFLLGGVRAKLATEDKPLRFQCQQGGFNLI